MKRPTVYVFFASLLVVATSRLVLFYSTVVDLTTSGGYSLSVFSLVGLSMVINPAVLFLVMYVLSSRMDLANNYTGISVALLSAGILGALVGTWLPSVTFWSRFQSYVVAPIDVYFDAGVYAFAIGFAASSLSYFRRRVRGGATSVGNLGQKSVRNLRRSLISFAGFFFGSALIGIAIRLATLINQLVVLSPTDYLDSITMVVAALFLMYKTQ